MAPVLESICDKNPTQKEAIAMDYLNHITDHEKGKPVIGCLRWPCFERWQLFIC